MVQTAFPMRGEVMVLSLPAEHAARAASIMEQKRIAIYFFMIRPPD